MKVCTVRLGELVAGMLMEVAKSRGGLEKEIHVTYRLETASGVLCKVCEVSQPLYACAYMCNVFAVCVGDTIKISS